MTQFKRSPSLLFFNKRIVKILCRDLGREDNNPNSSFVTSFGCQSHPPQRQPLSLSASITQKEEDSVHVFGQGLWIAVRLDLLPWFKAILSGLGSADQLPTNDAGGETNREVTSAADEEDLLAESGVRSSAGTDQRRRRVEFGSLVTGVELSAAVSGSGLATWRSAANRDGFVFNIERFGLRVALL